MPYLRYNKQNYIGIGKNGPQAGEMILVTAPTKAHNFTEDEIAILKLTLRFIGEIDFLEISEEAIVKHVEHHEQTRRRVNQRRTDHAHAYS